MRRILITALAFSFIITQTFGQGSVEAKLTFQEAVKIGLQNNVLLNQQKNQLDYTQINKVSSLLQLGPRIDGTLNAYRNDGNSFNQNEGKVVNGKIDFVNGSLNAQIPVFTGMNTVNLYRQANNANEAQLHQVNRSSQETIRDVANQYLTCLLDQQLIKIDQENVSTQQVQYDQIKAQVDLGSKAEADLYNQEYQLKNAELLLVRSSNKLKNDIATLALTLLIDPATYFEVSEVDWDLNTLLADSISLDQMYAIAQDRRSDLKQATFSEKAAHFNHSAFKGRYFPSIYAGASYGSRYNYIYGDVNRTFDQQFREDNTNFSYGLSMSIPIFYGLQYRSQSALSKVSYENAKIRTKNIDVTVKSDVIRAFQNFNDAKTSYAAAQAQLRAGELTYKMEKERYDLGISTLVQLTTTNQSYIKAQGDFQNAKYTLMFQRLLIDFAIGTLKIEDIPSSTAK
jgi:outer membrane protein